MEKDEIEKFHKTSFPLFKQQVQEVWEEALNKDGIIVSKKYDSKSKLNKYKATTVYAALPSKSTPTQP
jgi:hypothetical protein